MWQVKGALLGLKGTNWSSGEQEEARAGGDHPKQGGYETAIRKPIILHASLYFKKNTGL